MQLVSLAVSLYTIESLGVLNFWDSFYDKDSGISLTYFISRMLESPVTPFSTFGEMPQNTAQKIPSHNLFLENKLIHNGRTSSFSGLVNNLNQTHHWPL